MSTHVDDYLLLGDSTNINSFRKQLARDYELRTTPINDATIFLEIQMSRASNRPFVLQQKLFIEKLASKCAVLRQIINRAVTCRRLRTKSDDNYSTTNGDQTYLEETLRQHHVFETHSS